MTARTAARSSRPPPAPPPPWAPEPCCPSIDPPPVKAASGRDYDIEPSLPVDRVVRTTCSPNCTGSCGQLAFVRDGIVVKVQQAADYPDAAYNPRGCMKGLSYVNQIYGADRIMKPLVRTGERGSGEFREASWEEVLDRIAADFTRIGETWGWDSIHVFGQVPGSGLHPEGRQLPRLRAAGHEPRHELRLQRRPADGHADHVRRPERRARGEGLGEQPVPAAASAPTRSRRASRTSTSSSTRWSRAPGWWSWTPASRPRRPRPTRTSGSSPGRTPRWASRCAAR